MQIESTALSDHVLLVKEGKHLQISFLHYMITHRLTLTHIHKSSLKKKFLTKADRARAILVAATIALPKRNKRFDMEARARATI